MLFFNIRISIIIEKRLNRLQTIDEPKAIVAEKREPQKIATKEEHLKSNVFNAFWEYNNFSCEHDK